MGDRDGVEPPIEVGRAGDEADRPEIQGWNDAAILDRWLARAVTAPSVEDVLSAERPAS